ncbi:hypothetical protein ECZU41_46440 [Escherichia coli]|uniref:Uncharacterized protein n=2 Tax=Enterobacteriaceae TaxID=543 RepID=A0A6N3QLA0_SHIFL|nr:hypothetical protein UMNF18_3822 [Escherichia coli UMNF18]AIT36108.1 hypothetical protein LI75_18385 [Escherichia coli FAP1]AKF23391.1 hypothetical protein DP32_24290 [Escherichia coli]EFW59175.1 hypothetical protein SGF_03530 [Shigella flexneri CDC 796-83]EHV18483.1 hypothetical protein ECDEC5A_5118 [Escherichia coli DEC5A]EHV45856.1 hypothetical protein ECDEC5E_3705 [Escherichia coli DEC5E]EHV52221.1 hypothetical protein ECDEC6B_4707 [Escherichia coli DEC6B]EHV54693.1 hypothetical prote
MSEKTVTGEPRIKHLSGIGFRIPAAPASLTFRVADNPTEMHSRVILDKHIAVSCYDSNRLPV